MTKRDRTTASKLTSADVPASSFSAFGRAWVKVSVAIPPVTEQLNGPATNVSGMLSGSMTRLSAMKTESLWDAELTLARLQKTYQSRPSDDNPSSPRRRATAASTSPSSSGFVLSRAANRMGQSNLPCGSRLNLTYADTPIAASSSSASLPGMDTLAAGANAALGLGDCTSFGERYSTNLERQCRGLRGALDRRRSPQDATRLPRHAQHQWNATELATRRQAQPPRCGA